MKKGQVKNLAGSLPYMTDFLRSNFFIFFPVSYDCGKNGKISRKIALLIAPLLIASIFLEILQFLPATNCKNIGISWVFS